MFDQYLPNQGTDGWERRLRGEYLPSLARQVVDPLGCGDALLATASLTLAAGGSAQDAAFLGSLAAGVEAGQLGNQPVTTEQVLNQLNAPAPAMAPSRLAS